MERLLSRSMLLLDNGGSWWLSVSLQEHQENKNASEFSG